LIFIGEKKKSEMAKNHLATLYPNLWVYYQFLLWTEVVLIFIWLGFSIWALAVELDLSIETLLISFHFIAPAAMFYGISDAKEQLLRKTSEITTGMIQNGLYVVGVAALVDIIGVLRLILTRIEMDMFTTLTYALSALGIVFSLMSILHFICLVAAYFAIEGFIKKNSKRK